jgi:LPXTG-site transpeptidase (sortase) family protein
MGKMMRNNIALAICCFLLLGICNVAKADTSLSNTEYVSIQSDGRTLSTGSRAESPSVSGDGRYVVFYSSSANLVSGDTNGTADIFLKDMQTGNISILSKSAENVIGNGASLWPTISTNGRYVVFYSTAKNLVTGDTNGVSDVFLVDRGTDNDETNNSILRISVTTSGGQIDYFSAVRRGAVSSNGEFAVFSTNATGTAMGGITDTNRNEDIYLWSRSTGTTRLISHNYLSTKTAGNNASTNPIISDDGKYIAYFSLSTDLDANIGGAGLVDGNGLYDVFVYNVETDTNKLISLTTDNKLIPSSASGNPSYLSMSNTGKQITWTTSGQLDTTLDKNTGADIYLYDLDSKTVKLVSSFNYGSGIQHDSVNFANYCSAISANGRFVSFASYSVNLVPGKNAYNIGEVYVHDMSNGNNIRVSLAANGDEATSGSPYSMFTDISDDGKYVVYSSVSTGLVAGIDDTNSQYDIFRSFADWSVPSVISTSLQSRYTLTGPNGLTVTFNKPMTPADSTSPYTIITNVGANSRANYKLVGAGKNQTIDYSGCGADITTIDDELISIDSVVYDKTKYAAQIGINGGENLAVGDYRFIACGNTPYAPPALFDALGNKMDGDYIFDFSVTSANYTGGNDQIRLPLPITGFAPGKITPLVERSVNLQNSSTNMSLEIPTLGLIAKIVGVPGENGDWDISWLGVDVGWLQGSAYPTWQGNTVLTGHVWNADNQPGIFVNIKSLKYGDKILIHSGNLTYVYEVRENKQLDSDDFKIVFKHEELDWITLLTCEDFDPALSEYVHRRMVRAVLIRIE